MSRKLSKETIEKIRREVLSGKTKMQVAKEFGVNVSTVYRYTRGYSATKSQRTLYPWEAVRITQATTKRWLCLYIQ